MKIDAVIEYFFDSMGGGIICKIEDNAYDLLYIQYSRIYQRMLQEIVTPYDFQLSVDGRHTICICLNTVVMMAKNREKCNTIGKDGRERSEPLLAVPEDEREHPPHSLPRLSIVLPQSISSSVEIPVPKRPQLSHGDESMTVVLSAFYAKLLIVFTMYLYVISMIFLTYTFYHLRVAKYGKADNKRRIRYGSFYLHMGVAGFSVGSIIYSCLQFGEYFDLSGDCQLIIVALKPALRILFMVAQTVFIFSYTDILDPMRGVVLDRFGLMHLIATNVCEWINVVIQETRDDIVAVAYDRPGLLRYTNMTGPSKVVINGEMLNDTSVEQLFSDSNQSFIDGNITVKIEAWSCNVSDMITPLIRSMNPYLRPCGVEYSLLCSIIIAVIWNDICTVPGLKSTKSSSVDSPKEEKQCCGRVKSNSHFSVDCGNANKGLFMGVAVLAGTIVSLMLFNGLFQKENHINVWETILFVLMTVCSGACLHRMRLLSLRRMSTAMPLEHALLLITQCGVYLYYLFQIIGAGFTLHRYPEGRRATRFQATVCFYEIWKNSYKRRKELADEEDIELKNHSAYVIFYFSI
ncbi:unnamed protein product [Leptidea sinapis]|uniref:Uncharacterized protein n=1 Tax=Leptidea sinapis TaxID=189913 RepID=A0A5E4QBN5_9NEOP|nr:unnamed protein product [Leptidea sinapis]